MTGYELSTAHLETRDLAADRASLGRRLEAYRDRFPSPNPSLLIPPGAASNAEHSDNLAEVPEVTAANFNVETLNDALQERGALIVRDLFPAEEVSCMTTAIDQVLDACDSPRKVRATLSNHYFNPPENIVSILPEKGMELGALRLFSAAAGSAICVESPSIAEMLLEFYEHHGLKKIVTQYLGEAPVLSLKKWVLRRSTLPMEEAGWHQDGAFMGTDINTLNMWIPLTQCGGTTGAPGMDLIPQRLHNIQSAEGASFDWAVSDEQAKQTSTTASPIAPVFNPGDAFFFDHFYLHRTQYRPDFSKQRYAVETWFFGETTFPKNQIPIAW